MWLNHKTIKVWLHSKCPNAKCIYKSWCDILSDKPEGLHTNKRDVKLPECSMETTPTSLTFYSYCLVGILFKMACWGNSKENKHVTIILQTSPFFSFRNAWISSQSKLSMTRRDKNFTLRKPLSSLFGLHWTVYPKVTLASMKATSY